MNPYSCIPCDKYFNCIKPYEAHLKSEKHKKKVNEVKGIDVNSKCCEKTSSESEIEPFIVIRNTEYWCICCKSTLNSVSQVKSHISGIKHLKYKFNCERELSKDIPKLSISSNAPATIPHVDVNEDKHHFSFHGIKVEDVLKNIKIVGVNDPIIF